MTNQEIDSQEAELTVHDLRRWMEFACWTTLGLSLFLYWINGPAVSTDQFAVRTSLVVLAAFGAAGFRLYAWLHQR